MLKAEKYIANIGQFSDFLGVRNVDRYIYLDTPLPGWFENPDAIKWQSLLCGHKVSE